MQNLGRTWGLALLALLCCGEFLPAATYPADVPANPVYYKRYVRHRPAPHNPELEVYEVREVYFVRRTTPQPKTIRRLTDAEMDLRIRCDFESTLPKCESLTQTATTPQQPIETSSSSSTTTTTPRSTTTIPTTTTTTTTTSTTTTTTDLPFLPELPTESELLPESTITTTAATELDDNFPLEADEYDDDDSVKDNVYQEQDIDSADYATSEGSIGGNDTTK